MQVHPRGSDEELMQRLLGGDEEAVQVTRELGDERTAPAGPVVVRGGVDR